MALAKNYLQINFLLESAPWSSQENYKLFSKEYVWCVAFTATLYNKIFVSCHLCQMVKRQKTNVSRTIFVLRLVKEAISNRLNNKNLTETVASCWTRLGVLWSTCYPIRKPRWHSELLTPPTSPHWLAHCHEQGTRAGIYMARTGFIQTHQYPEDGDRDGTWNVGFFAF